jgi:erythromycin esterase-like protein
VDTKGDDLSYDSVTVMGHNAWQQLGDQMYVVGFTAHGGSWGRFNTEPEELPAPAPGSIEDLFGHTTMENAFLDFRRAPPGGEWLSQRLLMRPLWNYPMEADWTSVMDAVVFTRTMYPSNPTSR